MQINSVQRLLSERAYDEFSRYVWSQFDALIEHLGDRLAAAVIVDAKFINFLVNHVNAKIMVSSGVLKKDEEDNLSRIADVDWLEKAGEYSVSDVIHGVSARIRFLLKDIIARFLSASNLGRWKSAEIHILGSFSTSALYLGRSLDGKMLFKRAVDYYPISPPVAPDTSFVSGGPELAALESFMACIAKYVHSEFGLLLDIDLIVSSYKKRISQVYELIERVEFSSILKHIIISQPANPHHKIIAFAAKSKGIKIHAMSHGSEPGMFSRLVQSFIEYPQCNYYYVESSLSASLREKEYSQSRLSKRFLVEFRSYWGENSLVRQNCRTGHLKKILVVGYPATSLRYQFSGADFFFIQYPLERNLVNSLIKLDYVVTYKPHPAGRVTHLLDNDSLSLAIEDKKFEKIFLNYDLIVFPCVTSSTFGHALKSDIPILFFRYNFQYWNSRVISDLSARCGIVDVDIGDDLVASFDESTLQHQIWESLKKKTEAENFFNEYFARTTSP